MRASMTVLLLAWTMANGSPVHAGAPSAVVRPVAADDADATGGSNRASIRLLNLRVEGRNGVSHITLAEARREQDGVVHELTVVLAPERLRGTAFLIEDSGLGENTLWGYAPPAGRVRRLVAADAYSAFLSSDFTYADLGFTRLRTYYRFVREERRGETPAYRIEGAPGDPSHYSRTVLWLAADSQMPIERHFYDASHRLWKIQRFQDLAMIDGVPTLRHISMEDLHANTRTDIDVAVVQYGFALPASLFDPARLPDSIHSRVWQLFGGV